MDVEPTVDPDVKPEVKPEAEKPEVKPDPVKGDESSELTETVKKLTDHVSALRRKEELTPEALAEVDKHISRLETLVPKDEPKVDPTADDRIKQLEDEVAAGKQAIAVQGVVSKHNLTADELGMIQTDDVAELDKRAEKLRGVIDSTKRRAAVALPDDLKANETASRLMNN